MMYFDFFMTLACIVKVMTKKMTFIFRLSASVVALAAQAVLLQEKLCSDYASSLLPP